jgi:hypothetical protein
MAINAIQAIHEDLTITIGTGATLYVGSDSYPYYVSEVLPKGVYGLYSPHAHFEKSWTDGSMTVDKFDANHTSTIYLKRRYGKWWEVSPEGSPRKPFTSKYSHLHFGKAHAYRDPSF